MRRIERIERLHGGQNTAGDADLPAVFASDTRSRDSTPPIARSAKSNGILFTTRSFNIERQAHCRPVFSRTLAAAAGLCSVVAHRGRDTADEIANQ